MKRTAYSGGGGADELCAAEELCGAEELGGAEELCGAEEEADVLVVDELDTAGVEDEDSLREEDGAMEPLEEPVRDDEDDANANDDDSPLTPVEDDPAVPLERPPELALDGGKAEDDEGPVDVDGAPPEEATWPEELDVGGVPSTHEPLAQAALAGQSALEEHSGLQARRRRDAIRTTTVREVRITPRQGQGLSGRLRRYLERGNKSNRLMMFDPGVAILRIRLGVGSWSR